MEEVNEPFFWEFLWVKFKFFVGFEDFLSIL